MTLAVFAEIVMLMKHWKRELMKNWEREGGLSRYSKSEGNAAVTSSTATSNSSLIPQQHHSDTASSLVNWHHLMSALSDSARTSSLPIPVPSDAENGEEALWFNTAAQPFASLPGDSRAVVTFLSHVVRSPSLLCRFRHI
jgi:hypothetical protein